VFSGNVTVTGTLDHPELTGNVNLAGGTIGIRGFVNDFTRIGMSAHFDHDSLTLDNLSGESSLGGTFTANGKLSAADLGNIGNSPVTLIGIANSLRLQISNLTGTLGEKALFTINGQLVTTQVLAHPLLQGQLVATDALVQLPANLVPTSGQLPSLPINPSLSITMNLAKNVVLERGGLRATIQGPVTFAGVFPRPIVSGNVRIVTGKLSYVGMTLQIMPGGNAMFSFQPPFPAVITVDLTLQTKMTAISSITNRATRYIVYLDVSGTLAKPNVSVRSNPPGLTNNQALAGVFGGASLQAAQEGKSPQQLIQDQLGQVLLGLAVPAIIPPFTLGPFTLSLASGYDIPLEFTASVPLNDKFDISYSRSVVGRYPYGTFDLSYILSRHFALDVQVGGVNNAPNDTALLIEYYTRF
jgi:autotransporter translocation and assembly factor TamB